MVNFARRLLRKAERSVVVGSGRSLDPIRGQCYPSFVESTVVRLKLVFSRGSARYVALSRDAHGAVLLEYTILLGVVGISAAAALVILGIAFVDSFSFLREMLLTPFP